MLGNHALPNLLSTGSLGDAMVTSRIVKASQFNKPQCDASVPFSTNIAIENIIINNHNANVLEYLILRYYSLALACVKRVIPKNGVIIRRRAVGCL